MAKKTFPMKELENPVAVPNSPSKETAVNKSEEIRKLAREIQATGEKPRPVHIVNTLKERGVEVSSPMVSMVLKKIGIETRKSPRFDSSHDNSGDESFTVDQLLAAKDFSATIGSIKRAISLLEALQKLA